MLRNRHPYRLSIVTAIVTVLSIFSSTTPAMAQDAYYSWQGQFQSATDTQSFVFGLTNSVNSAETLHFNTWSHFGGTNAAGDLVASGGFDPILSLFDGDGASYGANDDGYVFDPLSINRDAYLTWLTQAPNPAAPGITTDPLISDGYVVKLTAFGGSFPSPWAVDLVAPAAKMAFTGLQATGSTIDSLKFGTTGAGANAATIDIFQLDTLTIASDIYVGYTGKGTLTSLGTINSGQAILGLASGSEGSVTLTASGNWLSSADVIVGDQGSGTLLIQSGAAGSFSGDAFLAFNSTGQGDVTVRDNGSLMVVGGDLEVGDWGVGTLNIEGGAWVNSSGVGTLSRDVIGDDALSSGTVTVTGTGVGGASRWDTDALIVANNGTGTLNVLAGGNVNSTAVEIATTTLSATGNATVNGANSLWDIAGSLDVGTTQISLINNATLTIENGGAVHVAGATTVNHTGTLNLTGSTLKTGSLSAAGPLNFNWTAGTLELTNSDVSLDSFFPDSVLGSSPTIGTGQALILSNAAGLGDLYVARTGTASMTINGGGDVTANDIYLAYNTTGNANVTVSGNGSTLTVNGDLEVGDGGTATMRIELGGVVDSSAVGPLSRDVIGDDANGWADGTVEVVGPGSQWHTDDLIVGDGGSGILHVLAGGNVSSQNVLIGENNTGTVNIGGPGSNWQLGTLTVGSGPNGPGNVNLTDQATIDSGSVIVGTAAASGNVTINGFVPGLGTRATWNVTGSVDIGSAGLATGSVIVEQTGRLNVSDSMTVVGSIDSTPVLTVRTAGEVVIANNLSVGINGTINLTDSSSRISTGSFTRSSNGAFNWTAGTLEITDEFVFLDSIFPHSVLGQSLSVGAGQKLIVSKQGSNGLDVGNTGVGSLNILNGGIVESHRGLIGVGSTSDGTALVDGLASQWNVVTDLRVASQGNAVGYLTIQNSGQVTSGSGFIGGLNSASGTVDVIGPGSNWTMSGELGVGVRHTSLGRLGIQNGGAVTCGSANLGIFDSADGTVLVDGSSGGTPSTLNVSSTMAVGGSISANGGTGNLTVSNGGEVNVGSTLRVWDGGEVDLLGGDITAQSISIEPGGLMQGYGAVWLGAGTLTNNGHVSPGQSTGLIDLEGLYVQTPGGELQIELAGGSVPGFGFDQLNVFGTASLDGLLTLALTSLYTPLIGDSFPIIDTYAGVTGRFDTIQFPLLGATGLRIDYSNPNSVYVRAALAGDLNLDGFVGIEDLNIVLGVWNQNVDAGVWQLGDPSGDGFIGIEDLNVVLGNWNAGTPPPPGAVIPEPGTLVLLGLGAFTAIRWRY